MTGLIDQQNDYVKCSCGIYFVPQLHTHLFYCKKCQFKQMLTLDKKKLTKEFLDKVKKDVQSSK